MMTTVSKINKRSGETMMAILQKHVSGVKFDWEKIVLSLYVDFYASFVIAIWRNENLSNIL